MENQRVFLFAALLFVLFLIWQAWQKDYAPAPASATSVSETTATLPAGDNTALPTVATPTQPATTPAAPAALLPAGDLITVATDVLEVEINTAGGALQTARLLDYAQSSEDSAPVALLHPTPVFVAQSGLRGYEEREAPGVAALYRADQHRYQLAEGKDTVSVTLHWQDAGLTVEKTYTFTRGSYQVDLRTTVHNIGDTNWQGDAFVQLQQQHQESEGGTLQPRVYSGPAWYDGEHYQKIELDELTALNSEAFATAIRGGWAAVVHHYFLAAILPPADAAVRYFTRQPGAEQYIIGYVLPAQSVAPGASAQFDSRLFLGPKLQDRLAGVAPGLDRAVDYGVLTIIAQPLFWLLEKIHGLLGNWGWAIIVLTLLIKILFYKPSEISGRSMAKMRKIAPRLKTLKERYADDRQRYSMAMMELYKQEKINPAAGCLPMLIQLPVFFALYWVLLYSVELRQAPWILWIHDLTTRDPYFVLPVLVGAAMFFQQKMNPPPPDPMQAKVMAFMPLIMLAFSIFMPAGLVLYWFVNTLLSAAQQWQINRVVERAGR